MKKVPGLADRRRRITAPVLVDDDRVALEHRGTAGGTQIRHCGCKRVVPFDVLHVSSFAGKST